MTSDQITARLALRAATRAIAEAKTELEREIAKFRRATAAGELRAALNVEPQLPCFLRRQAE